MRLDRPNCTGVGGEVVDNMNKNVYYVRRKVLQKEDFCFSSCLHISLSLLTCCVYVKPQHVKHATLEWHFHCF